MANETALRPGELKEVLLREIEAADLGVGDLEEDRRDREVARVPVEERRERGGESLTRRPGSSMPISSSTSRPRTYVSSCCRHGSPRD